MDDIDREIDELAVVLASGIQAPFDARTIYGSHYSEWIDKNKDVPRVKAIKSALKRLIVQGQIAELDKIEKFRVQQKVFSAVLQDYYIDRIAQLKQQLQPEGNNQRNEGGLPNSTIQGDREVGYMRIWLVFTISLLFIVFALLWRLV